MRAQCPSSSLYIYSVDLHAVALPGWWLAVALFFSITGHPFTSFRTDFRVVSAVFTGKSGQLSRNLQGVGWAGPVADSRSPATMAPTAAEIASAGDHLDEHGWCVIKNVVSTEIADDSCCMMDEFLGPHCKDIAAVPDQAEAAASGVRWMQKGVQWPEPAAAGGGAPVLHTGGYAHSLQHPLRDARSAAVVGPMAPIMQQLLRSSPEGLKLFHQNYRRTDPSPPPEDGSGYAEIVDGAIDGGRAGFHMDSGFLPSHYTTTPRLNYYITILALSPVVSGGAAFMYAPGSLQAALKAGAALPPQQAETITAKGCRAALPKLVGQGVPGYVSQRTRNQNHP
eukprot:COSAG06_NODE_389_length_16410_cov_39.606952_3_plen_338_part_00